MENMKLTFALIAIATAFTSCKDEKQIKAQKATDAYTKYVDSVSNITQENAVANWETIENDYAKLKLEAENSIENSTNSTDKTKLQTNLSDSESKYEEFKNDILSEKEKN